MKFATYSRVIVACKCGTLPLNDHADAQTAWEFAAAHVTRTSDAYGAKCTPAMYRDSVTVPVR